MKRFGITYANGPDLQTKIGPRYHISGVPETYVIDRDGNVQFTKISPVTVAELSSVIGRLLQQKVMRNSEFGMENARLAIPYSAYCIPH